MNTNDISKLYDEKKVLIADRCIICGVIVYRYGIEHTEIGAMIEKDPIICSRKKNSCKEAFLEKARPTIKTIGEEPKMEKKVTVKKSGKKKVDESVITEQEEMKD